MEIRFQEVRATRSKSGTCAVCGKTARRQTAFFQTLNPFNKNADGYPKTRYEIMLELNVRLDEWEKLPVKHAACE